MKKIAIIGAGVVGATAAYYLSKEDLEVTVFDEGVGQATKAAAGIICPWFSKRRHKAWYRLARLGADFYQDLLLDLQRDGQTSDFYQQKGVLLLKKDATKLSDLFDLARKRKEESPLIGDLELLSGAEIARRWPDFVPLEAGLYASGAARVDGAKLTASLLTASQAPVIQKQVNLQVLGQGSYEIDGQVFDGVILAAGAWLGQVLEPLGYQVDIRPQKGQLRDYVLRDFDSQDYPVLMPEGELDIIPFAAGKVSVGASHENDQGFDLNPNQQILEEMSQSAQAYLPKLAQSKESRSRVGTRAYTSDFAPFFGQMAALPQVYAASGLGSSGLTTGPLLGKTLVELLLGQETVLDPRDYPIDRYISRVADDRPAKKC